MRIFIVSLAAVAILAGAAYLTLSPFQQSIADAYVTSSSRLDQQESVNWYGRETNPS